MPFKSQSQRRLFHALEARGEMPAATVKRWEEETPKKKKLPEYAGEAKKRALAKLAGK